METVTNYAVLLAQVASELKDKKLANIKSHQAKIYRGIRNSSVKRTLVLTSMNSSGRLNHM